MIDYVALVIACGLIGMIIGRAHAHITRRFREVPRYMLIGALSSSVGCAVVLALMKIGGVL